MMCAFPACSIKQVQKGLDEFLFKLLILRYLMDSEGKMWKCSDKQLYLIEILQPTDATPRQVARQVRILIVVATTCHNLFNVC